MPDVRLVIHVVNRSRDVVRSLSDGVSGGAPSTVEAGPNVTGRV